MLRFCTVWLCLLAPALLVHAGVSGTVLVVGSINADILVPVERLPEPGETVVALDTEEAGRTVAGGKGANQAVSCRRLGCAVCFACQLGGDANAVMLENTLVENDIDLSFVQRSSKPSGLGLVFLEQGGGTSCVVVGGSNAAWPQDFDADALLARVPGLRCVMLQMEVPQWVNERIAAAACRIDVPVFQDAGGAVRELSSEHLQRCTYISPNRSELRRLAGMSVDTDDEVLTAARHLQSRGARNVLVTLGTGGSLLLMEEGEVLHQECIKVGRVVDETGAGDNFRGGFVTARFVEGQTLAASLEWAAAAGAVSVTRLGAIPSCSRRDEVESLLATHRTTLGLRGGCRPGGHSAPGAEGEEEECPWLFASRLNSMRDRADLWSGAAGLAGLLLRQGAVRGLALVDFNYPQHLTEPLTPAGLQQVTTLLAQSGLQCGAVCLRFPKAFQLGAFTNPDAALRARAVQLTKDACEWAEALGAQEVVVWSAFDGYDYSLQVDYDVLWRRVVEAFQEVCDAHPRVRVSLEYKPTDENTRFFAVPSTGAAVLLAQEVDRDNFGLTLDFGHCLMAGENPAQAVALASRVTGAGGRSNKLFGVQLGDGYGRLGAEDGLVFGSVHSRAALEFVLWLIRTEYKGHIYFDTFPRNEDPVREGEFNIRQFKRYYRLARRLLQDKQQVLERFLQTHDAMGMLEHLESLDDKEK